MQRDNKLCVTAKEIANSLEVGPWAEAFPPILSVEQAAQLFRVPVRTIYDWRSRGLLAGCSRKLGKRVIIFRDKLLLHLLNNGLEDDG